MKKFFIIILMLIILAFAVFLGFRFITNNGLFVETLYLINSDGQVIMTENADDSTALLLNTLRSGKNSTVPPETTVSLSLKTVFNTNFTMRYPIRYNPYTGDGYIEKGLFKKAFYKIPDKTMSMFLDVEKSEITIDNKNLELHIDQGLTKMISSKRAVLVDSSKIAANLPKFNLSETLFGSTLIKGELIGDSILKKVFYKTPEQCWQLPSPEAEQILSQYPFWNRITEIEASLPNIGLRSDSSLDYSLFEYDWWKKSPDAEFSSHSATEINKTTFSITPGTSLHFYSGSSVSSDSLSIEEYHNESLVKTYDSADTAITVPRFEGTLKYILNVNFEKSETSESFGQIKKEYSFQMNFPAEAVILYNEAGPGDVLSFCVFYSDKDEAFSIESDLGNFKADFMPYEDKQIVYMPINWWTTPNNYSATIYRHTENKKEVLANYAITVLPDNFVTVYQKLVVSKKLAEKADPANTANDYVMVREAKSHSHETSLLDGLFIMPLNGALGTSYAQTRYINGKNPYRHSGLDIDGDTGDPIVAANRGIVVFSGELVRTGKTVIIDHGMQLFSSYLHMSKLIAEVGSTVEKGELIGKVGSTGFSTGPHLHWSITLYGNYVSPLWLVENALIPE